MKLYARLFPIYFLCIIFHHCNGFYSDSDNVITLTPDNFDQLVIKSNEIWIVEFYAPWCIYCQNIASEYIKTANALRGIIKVGAVDADVHKELTGRYGVRGLPTIKIFGVKKLEPEDYNEAKNSKQLIEASLKATRDLILNRLSLKDQETFMETPAQSLDIIELTDNNFDELVLKSDDLWIVEFYAHWCGHCKALEPHWLSAAKTLKGKVKFGKLDGSVNKNKTAYYDVTAYPAIKFFFADKNEHPLDYNGGRRSSDIVEWLTEKIEAVPLPDVHQIIDEEALRFACEGKTFCILSFLPNLLDCQSVCRIGYIKMLRTLADKFRKSNWGWGWSEVDEQPDLQKIFKINKSGIPALAAANYIDKKYALLNRPFTEESIYDFLNNLAHNKEATFAIKRDSIPDIYFVEPWDDDIIEKKDEL